MLFLRIKQCEAAVAGGRLDEAFELLRADDVRSHRRGQELVDLIVKRLVERGRGHLAAGRISAARGDCERAARLGGNLAEVSQLRFAVDRADAGVRERDGVRERVVANARRLLAAGQLTVAGDVLGATAVEGDARAEAMRGDVAVRKATVERAVAAAEEALERDDWQGAMDHVSRARGLSPAAAGARKVSRKIGRRVVEEVNELVEAGRMDGAEMVLARAAGLGDCDVGLSAARMALARCRAAADCVRGGRFGEAREILRGVAAVWPRARWIDSAVRSLEGVDEALGVVRSGALGLLGETPGNGTAALGRRLMQDEAPGARDATTLAGRGVIAMAQRARESSSSSAEKFTLQVDGVGSFLVFRGSAVKVGPVSGGGRPDLALMTDAGTPTVMIARSEEDYFLQSPVGVGVNEKVVRSKLLCDGDRIALGPRCRIVFRRPNAASASAVLEISGARLARGDVRQVILMDREIVIGDSAAAHVRTREVRGPAVLLAEGGGLALKAEGRMVEVVAGAHVRVGTLGVVVT